MTNGSQPQITIAIICKNEAPNIRRCLESVIREGAAFKTEILVIDSYSTDGTVEIARTFPVVILQLGKDWPHSPAAGRYIAVLHARGRYLLLIDGDMELLPGFLQQAFAQMEADRTLVAVRGRLHNFHRIDEEFIYVDSKFATVTASKKFYLDSQFPVPIECASGSALFSLKALLDVGNFHPFLKAEEEYEVARRLRAQGGRMLYLPIDAVNHYGYHSDPLAEVVRRLRRGLVSGAGQMFRLSLHEGYAFSYLRRIRQHLLVGFFFLLLLPVLVVSLAYPAVIAAWSGLCCFLLAAYLVKTRNVRLAFASFLVKGLIGIDIFRGLIRSVPARDKYPTAVTVVDGTLEEGGLK